MNLTLLKSILLLKFAFFVWLDQGFLKFLRRTSFSRKQNLLPLFFMQTKFTFPLTTQNKIKALLSHSLFLSTIKSVNQKSMHLNFVSKILYFCPKLKVKTKKIIK